jgi:signal transduction histidine kinase
MLRRLLLHFEDPDLETEFSETRFRRSLPMIRIACAIGTLLVVGFYSIDPTFIPEDELASVRALRAWIVIPGAIAALLTALLIKQRLVVRYILTGIACLVGVSWSVMLVAAGPSTSDYLGTAIVITALSAFFLLGLPFYFAAAVSWSITLVYMTALYSHANSGFSAGWLLNGLVSVVTIVGIVTYAAYLVENNARRLFMRSVELEEEQNRRVDSDHARLSWLENIARFLRHELRNTMIGISSSLDLMNRKGVTPGTEAYMDRARQSVEYMRKLLQDSAEATTLEISLEGDDPHPLNIASWLPGHVEHYRQNYPDTKFEVEISSRALIAITEERIAQLTDKLVSNAVEHSTAGLPIKITLHQTEEEIVLSVTNYGDRLPEDKSTMFDLFNSTKSAGSHENIGLGLYVARTIAESHGGSINARDHIDPPGAVFEVRLPAGFFNFRNRAGRPVQDR